MHSKVIWVINQFAGTPESGWGERHFYFAKQWKSLGYDVKIISGSFNHMFINTRKVNGLFEHEDFDGIDFYWVKTPKYNPKSVRRFFSMLIFTMRVLRLPVHKLGKPDTIIVSSMPIFPIYAGVKLKKRFGAKLLFEIRDIWPLTLQLLGGYSAHNPAVRFIGWFEKLGYRKSDSVISLLPNAREHVQTVAKQSVDFHYIPNGIDQDLLVKDSLPESISKNIPKNKFIIGYAGTIGLANALEYFIDAAIMLSDKDQLFFVVVGDGYLKEELIDKSKGRAHIVFLPKIKKNQVQDLLSHFDVCFVGRNDSPLFQHGVSANKYFDYMLAGKPILDSNNLIKDPVELSGGGVIVKPDSAKAIKDGILYLYNLPKKEREIMGLKGQEFVQMHHKISKLALEYSRLF